MENISYEFAEKFYKRIIWNDTLVNILCANSCYLLKKCLAIKNIKLPWDAISKNPNLTIDIIEKNSDKINFDLLYYEREFSIEFAEKFKDKLSWDKLSLRGLINETFVGAFINQINIPKLRNNLYYIDLIFSKSISNLG
jgi:hypothetical protein